MSAVKNMALARRFMEARVKGDLDAMDEMMAPDYVSHAKLLPDQQPDREGEKWVAAQLAAAFSNRRILVEDQVAGGTRL
jgi:ketosteroid isomerase-like protein